MWPTRRTNPRYKKLKHVQWFSPDMVDEKPLMLESTSASKNKTNKKQSMTGTSHYLHRPGITAPVDWA